MTIPPSSPPPRTATPQPPPRAPGSFYVRTPDSAAEALMSWPYIQHIIAAGDLDDLYRTQRCEDEYASWAKPIRARWGNLEAYIRDVRLAWAPADEATNKSAVHVNEAGKVEIKKVETWPEAEMAHPDGSGRALRHFIDDPRLEGPGEDGEAAVKCIPNDWSYAVPDGVEHWVVWSKLPILHPDLFAPSDDDAPFPPVLAPHIYSCILNDGVRGSTSTAASSPIVYGNLSSRSTSLHLRRSDEPFPPPPPRSCFSAADREMEARGTPSADAKTGVSLDQSSKGQAWAGRYVDRFVRRRWNEQRYEAVWFCNPPHLRTVPGLSHFHVFVRRKEDAST